MEIEVWDPFVRLFHWSLVTAFAVTYFTGEDWRDVHLAAGWAALGLIGFRILWGFVGTRYARFATFVMRPKTVAAYLQLVSHGREARYVGHNPAGGAMVVLLLALVASVGVTGVLLTTDAFWGSDAMDHLHGLLADLTAACVVAHIAGVLFTSFRTRENLVRSMITGRKRPADGGDIG